MIGAGIIVLVVLIVGVALVVIKSRQRRDARKSRQNFFSSNQSTSTSPSVTPSQSHLASASNFKVLATSTSQSALPVSHKDGGRSRGYSIVSPRDQQSVIANSASYGSTAPILAATGENRSRSNSATSRARSDSAASRFTVTMHQTSAMGVMSPTTPKTPNSATPLMIQHGSPSPAPITPQPSSAMSMSMPPAVARTSRYYQNLTLPPSSASNDTSGHTQQKQSRNPSPSVLPDGSSTQPLMMKVLHSYSPVLADELELKEGQDILILTCFDDGWGLGMVPETGAQGAFPLICVIASAPSVTTLSSPSPQSQLNSALPQQSAVGSDYQSLLSSASAAYPNINHHRQSQLASGKSPHMTPLALSIEQQIIAQERLSAMMRRSGIMEFGSAKSPLRRVSSKRGTSQAGR
ncbi:hypothetical protein HDU67_007917 [Dinochytrium kinnereticum]|nr:hypothetical protein HDU67_007917 [Dinochytrium kinnereticum]